MQLIIRDPAVGYWGTELWLPKQHIPLGSIKAGLTFPVEGTDEVVTIWRETAHHLIVPREMFTPEKLRELGFPIYDVSQRSYEEVSFADLFVPRPGRQERAWEALAQAKSGGVLNVACGGGKTGLALKKAAQLRGPTLVVISNTGTMDQWVKEAMRFLGLREEDIGLVQGPKFDWQKPLVVATIQTLARHADQLPDAFLRRWKLVIFDEVHHTPARTFSRVLPLFHGVRLGLTATLSREDGLETVFLYHVGQPVFVDLTQEVPVTVCFQHTPYGCDMQDPAIVDKRGLFNIGKFYGYLGNLPERNAFLAQHIRWALHQGRKILGLTHCREHTEELQRLVPDSGVIHGGVPHGKRLQILREHRVVLATPGCAEEALDDETLDTIMFFTPYQVWRTFQQGAGRAQRAYPGKKSPLVVLFEDVLMPPARGLFGQLRRNLRENNYNFQTVRA